MLVKWVQAPRNKEIGRYIAEHFIRVPHQRFLQSLLKMSYDYIAIEYCSNKKRSDKRVAASGFCVHQCWSIGCKARRNRIEYKVLVQVLEVAVLVVVVAAVVDVYQQQKQQQKKQYLQHLCPSMLVNWVQAGQKSHNKDGQAPLGTFSCQN